MYDRRSPVKIGKEFSVGCSFLSMQAKMQAKVRRTPDGIFRDLIMGAVEFHNSAGAYYTLKGAHNLLDKDNFFYKNLKNNKAFGEYGHPTRPPGMSDDAWFNRIMYPDEQKTCHLHTEVWLDKVNTRSHGNQICFISDLKTTGPYGDTLERELLDPYVNTSFSIRSITDDLRVGGRWEKEILTASGFDKVNLPGIAVAEKYNSASLESAAINAELARQSMILTMDDLVQVVDNINSTNVSTEAANAIKHILHDIRKSTRAVSYGSAINKW